MPDINYLAVLVSAVAAMLLGALWYGPLFGKKWVEGMGWDPNNQELMNKMKQGAGLGYLQQFIGALFMAFVFAHVLWAFRIVLVDMGSAMAGIQGAFWMWLGFILPVKYGEKLWGGKQLKYVSIDLMYYLVNLIVMALILSLWR